MQEYLHRSIESLLSESIIKDIEIIIVNDGSTDKTLEIAQKYYEKNPTSTDGKVAQRTSSPNTDEPSLLNVNSVKYFCLKL